MAGSGCLLLEADDGWRLGLVGSSAESFDIVADRHASPTDLAKAVVAQCETLGHAGADLVVAVHSDSVVSALFPADRNVNTRDRRAMLFELEPSLPFDAEDAVADFAGEGANTVGVAMQHGRLSRFVTTVEEHGFRLQSIFPLALAALQSFADDDGCYAWRTSESVELMEIRNGNLGSWRQLPVDVNAVTRELRVRNLHAPKLLEEPNIEADSFATEIGAINCKQASMWDHASKFAATVISGNTSPWIELRRDVLANGDPNRPYRQSLNWLTIAGLALLILFSVACWWRAGKYSEQAERFAADQRKLYKEAFPGKRVPRAPMSRLRSERSRLLGLSGSGENVKLPVSAIEPIVNVVSGLRDHRVQVSELRVSDGMVDLTIQMRDYAAISSLKRAIEDQGFAVETGSQDLGSDGFVSTTLSGKPRSTKTDGGQP